MKFGESGPSHTEITADLVRGLSKKAENLISFMIWFDGTSEKDIECMTLVNKSFVFEGDRGPSFLGQTTLVGVDINSLKELRNIVAENDGLADRLVMIDELIEKAPLISSEDYSNLARSVVAEEENKTKEFLKKNS